MAKAGRSFADKARKHAEGKPDRYNVRVIKSVRDPLSGTVRFLDRVVTVPSDADLDQYLNKLVKELD